MINRSGFLPIVYCSRDINIHIGVWVTRSLLYCPFHANVVRPAVDVIIYLYSERTRLAGRKTFCKTGKTILCVCVFFNKSLQLNNSRIVS